MQHYTQEHVNKILDQKMEDYNLSFKAPKGYYKVFDGNIDNTLIYPYTLEGLGDCLVDFIKALKSMGMNYNADRFLISECEDYDDKPLFKMHRACFGVYPRIKMLQFPVKYPINRPSVEGEYPLPSMDNFGLQPGNLFRHMCKKLYLKVIFAARRRVEMGYSDTIAEVAKMVRVNIADIKRFFKYVLEIKEYLDKESAQFEIVAKKYDFFKENVNWALENLRWCGYFTPPEIALNFSYYVLESYFQAYKTEFADVIKAVNQIKGANKMETSIMKAQKLTLFMKEQLMLSYYGHWNFIRKDMEDNWVITPYQKELLATDRLGYECAADPKLDEDIPVLRVIANAAVEIWRYWSNYFPRTTGDCLLDFKKGRYTDGTRAKGPVWKALLEGQYYAFMKRLTLEQLKYESKFYQSTDFFEYLIHNPLQTDYIKERHIDPLNIIYRHNPVVLNTQYHMSVEWESGIEDVIPYHERDFEETLRSLNPDHYRLMMAHRQELKRIREEEKDEEKRKQRMREANVKYQKLMAKYQ